MTKVDITPDKTLIKKLGMSGYRTEQAIAELIDNAIDARGHDTEHIKVMLDFTRMRITIQDDGHGMNLAELQDALTIAKDAKAGGRLGRFGMGMKSACSSLGKAFHIKTARSSQETLMARYDEDEWLDKQDMQWNNFEIEHGDSNIHGGTTITISRLKVPLYPNQMIKFRRRFGLRYGPYIRDRQVEITVNSRVCHTVVPDLEEGTRRDIRVELPSGNVIAGWMGLLKRRSIKGDYGLHIYNRKRLVEAYSKFGIKRHPTTSKFIGEISLDHVPLNFHKTGFLKDTDEYREAQEYFGRSEVVTGLIRSISQKSNINRDELDRMREFWGGAVQVTPLSMKVGAARARSILYGMEGAAIKAGDMEILVRRKPDRQTCLYSTEHDSEKTRVVINSSSRMFEAFRNPLLLLGFIKIEAEVFGGMGVSEQAIAERNRLWNEFADTFLPTKDSAIGQTKPRQTTIPLSQYTLQPELVELHDYLKEEYPHRFQFTGLSTLAPFLHNAHSTLLYTIQAETGTGQELSEVITCHGQNGRPLLNPTPNLLSTYLEVYDGPSVMVIREHSERLAYTWAPPEKAWLDLYIETESGAAPYANEMVYILDELLDMRLAIPSKIRTLAKRRGPNMLKKVERFLPD